MLVEGDVYDALLSAALIVAAWRLASGDAGVSEAVRPSATKAMAVGGGIGLASGVIGLGGGIFLLPALILGRWATAKEAAATTSLFVWLNSLAGLAGASIAGRLLTGTMAGSLITGMGYVSFYLLTTLLAMPGVVLFWYMIQKGLVDLKPEGEVNF